jgi:oligosaccharide repeat unit polymerase
MRSLDYLAVGTFVALALLNFRLGKKHILFPPFLFCSLWAAMYIAYLFFPTDLNEIGSSTTILLVVGGALCFTCGGVCVLVQSLLTRGRTAKTGRPSRMRPAVPFYKLLLFTSVAILPLSYREFHELSRIGGSDNLFNSARAGLTVLAQEQNYAASSILTANAPTFAIFVLFLFLFEYLNGTVSPFWLVTSFCNAAVFAFLTTGRTAFLLIFVGTIGAKAIRMEQPPYKTIVAGMVVFFALFVSLIFVFKQVDVSRSFVETVNIYTLGYLAGPIVALDEVISAPWRFALDVNHTFSPIMRVFSPVLGIPYQAPPVLDVFVFIPFPFNTYSMYKFYFLDFGFYGTLLVLFLIGVIQTWLFRAARRGKPIFEYVFLVSLYPLVTSVFDDSYFQSIYNLKVVVFAATCYHFVPSLVQRTNRPTHLRQRVE